MRGLRSSQGMNARRAGKEKRAAEKKAEAEKKKQQKEKERLEREAKKREPALQVDRVCIPHCPVHRFAARSHSCAACSRVRREDGRQVGENLDRRPRRRQLCALLPRAGTFLALQMLTQ